ncbi:PaaI family thioesterase [Aminipila sp.]|uniref:PaaI family thioesterase n=1 Tax=Aminipila sp. TaxID=2060095 RepID=UPI00289E5DD3|nr:PaaI family thioesterase [Aminipila sp.]
MTIDELFQQQDLEKNMKFAIEKIKEQPGRLNDMLEIQFVECDAKERTVTYELPFLEWEMNPKGILHGGITAAMMDLSLGLFANCICWQLGGFFAPTVNMNMNYLQPISFNDRICIKAQLVSSGRSLLILNGEARAKGCEQIAVTASATYKVMRK